MASLQIPFSHWSNAAHTVSIDTSVLYDTVRMTGGLGRVSLVHQTPRAIWLFMGLESGVLWKWTIPKDLINNGELKELMPEFVMTGHRSAVKALAMAKYRMDCTGFDLSVDQESDSDDNNNCNNSNNNSINNSSLIDVLLSTDEAGELAMWNCHDGRCLLHNLKANVSSSGSGGDPHTISVTPSNDYCIISGHSDKLVVIKIATLEIVQIIDIGSSNWVQSGAFLTQDNPELLHDFLTLGGGNSRAESILQARQFDQQIGQFVSAPHSILPSTLPSSQLNQFSTAKLFKTSSSHPGLGVIVTMNRVIWLMDFLSGDFTLVVCDFPVDGVEFVRYDLLLAWSKSGMMAFYQAYLSEANLEEEILRPKSPLLGHIIRKLDFTPLTLRDPQSSFVKIKLLNHPESGDANICSSMIWIESVRSDTFVSLIHVEFDPMSAARTVHLVRKESESIPLLFGHFDEVNESHMKEEGSDGSNNVPSTTCTIFLEPFWLIEGFSNGQVSKRSVLDYFECWKNQQHKMNNNNNNNNDDVGDFIPELSSIMSPLQPELLKYPVTTMLACRAPILSTLEESIIIVVGNDAGWVSFWLVDHDQFKLIGQGYCHCKRVLGVTSSMDSQGRISFYSWSAAGSVALHRLLRPEESLIDGTQVSHQPRFITAKIFQPTTRHARLTGLYCKGFGEYLLLEYDDGSRRMWNVFTGAKMSDQPLPTLMEFIASSEKRLLINTMLIHRDPGNSSLFEGTIALQLNQWPDVPCQTLLVDIRGFVEQLTRLKTVRMNELSVSERMLIRVAKGILAQFLAWGASLKLDHICRSRLGLYPMCRQVTCGLIGANGNISLILNPPEFDRFWTLSPVMTATLQLSILVLLTVLPWDESSAPYLAMMITFYAAQIGVPSDPDDDAGKYFSGTFKPAALSFLTKYWQDPNKDIQQAARILFSATLARLNESSRAGLIRYWQDYLPSSAGQDGRAMNRSAIILGIIGSQEPKNLSEPLKKQVAESLLTLLVEDKRNLFRLAGIELIGKGYSTWKPFIHGASIFQLMYNWLVQMTPNSMNPTGLDIEPTETAYQITRTALLFILADDAGELLKNWFMDLGQARSWNERRCTLAILRGLLRFRPTCLLGNHSLLCESLIRLLDPSTASVRQTVYLNVLDLLRELQDTFGSIALGGIDQQRLAVGNQDGSISIYDLKSATRSNILEGHVHPVTTVTFNPRNPEGRALLSYSAGEACLRWWSLPSGIFSGLLGTTVRPLKTVVVEAALSQALECIPDGSVFKLKPVTVKWNDNEGDSVGIWVGSILTMTTKIN